MRACILGTYMVLVGMGEGLYPGWGRVVTTEPVTNSRLRPWHRLKPYSGQSPSHPCQAPTHPLPAHTTSHTYSDLSLCMSKVARLHGAANALGTFGRVCGAHPSSEPLSCP